MREVPGSNPGRALIFEGKKEKRNLIHEKKSAVTRIRTWVVAATTQSTNHYTITADALMGGIKKRNDSQDNIKNLKLNCKAFNLQDINGFFNV